MAIYKVQWAENTHANVIPPQYAQTPNDASVFIGKPKNRALDTLQAAFNSSKVAAVARPVRVGPDKSDSFPNVAVRRVHERLVTHRFSLRFLLCAVNCAATCDCVIQRRGWCACLPDMENFQAILDLLWQVLDIFAVLCRQQDCLDTSSECADKLLLDSSDSGNAASERDFALCLDFVSICQK